MARIHDLIRQVATSNPSLASDLEREVDVLSERRAFGLNFERHTPEEVESPGRPVRRGDKVHVLPPRGGSPKVENHRMWVVDAIDKTGGEPVATLTSLAEPVETSEVLLSDLVVVAEFRDPIYPGLVSTGRVLRGGGRPYHSVINAENFHALQTLLFTHRGKVDAVYIDPPYNTGARDWKYNNDYVESDDQYRHSKWLAFMERRLILAKELLDPDDSVLIVTIDEKELHRLGLLIEQVLSEARIQFVSTLINPAAVARKGYFGRSDEYIVFVMIGAAGVEPLVLPEGWVTTRGRTHTGEIRWDLLRKSGSSPTRDGHPETFYPFFVSNDGKSFHSVGEPIGVGASRHDVSPPEGTFAVWPIRRDGSEGRWRLKPGTVRQVLAAGALRLGAVAGENTPVYYLAEGERSKIEAGLYQVTGLRPDGSVITSEMASRDRRTVPGTQWRMGSHDATQYGTRQLIQLLPDRRFPFPKSLYAVEDTLRFFVANKPEAIVVDFFTGSGTTAHAVMRLNKQDGGRRVSISVTNNEVSADEQGDLRKQGLRPGDAEWERWGICEYITKPRIEAAITGKTPGGEPIRGDYKFTDEFSMADGFEENVEFFTLTYEAPLRVASSRDFPKVAPLLWLRAGSRGRRIDDLPDGWDVADSYGALADLDKSEQFVTAIAANPDVTHAFVITDEDRLFESIVRGLPEHVEPVRMYDAYLRNFELESRVVRWSSP